MRLEGTRETQNPRLKSANQSSPRQEIEALLAIAHQGDATAIGDRLETWDDRYRDFASPLLQLARYFKIEEIEELLQHHLNQPLNREINDAT